MATLPKRLKKWKYEAIIDTDMSKLLAIAAANHATFLGKMGNNHRLQLLDKTAKRS